MNSDRNLSSNPQLPSDSSRSKPEIASSRRIEEIAAEIYELAKHSQHDPIALLHLLRTLELVHHGIQDDYFQLALPDSRQALYAFLKNIEENGGWPYIQRWKLQALLANLAETELS
jgi:hypothetical protein